MAMFSRHGIQGSLFQELRRCWLLIAGWQLITAVTAIAAAAALHRPASVAFALVGLLAGRGSAQSLAIWRRR